MEYFNEMEVVFDSRSENEGFARVAVAVYDADGSGSGGSGRREDSGL